MEAKRKQIGDVIVVSLIGTGDPMELNLFDVFGPVVEGQKFVVDCSGVVEYAHPMFWSSFGAWFKGNQRNFLRWGSRMVCLNAPDPLKEWIRPTVGYFASLEEAIESLKKNFHPGI